ncbi:MAG TPA: DNA adenine methylase [Spirochaetota bacterium]|nr:DNA adenine methylase [Spirochaetota bacterium]
MIDEISMLSRPFIKWAGGKSQLIDEIDERLPVELREREITTYFEPFLGGGAVFFYIAQKFSIERAVLFDINEDLIITYKVIKYNPEELMRFIDYYKYLYNNLDIEKQKDFFYSIRENYNKNKVKINFNDYNNELIEHAAQMIFLNKTCYNGLYRLNSKGEFNVPFGKYKKVNFYDKENILYISALLQKAELYIYDFEEIIHYDVNNAFIYFDPPYRPISQTASFTSYSKFHFSENDQIRLATIFKELDKRNARLMLSNSDPKNVNPDDDFFEKHYKGFNIQRVYANRMINCNGEKRGKINELIITNY